MGTTLIGYLYVMKTSGPKKMAEAEGRQFVWLLEDGVLLLGESCALVCKLTPKFWRLFPSLAYITGFKFEIQ